MAIRDALNRKSRKPFYWGGLKGYEQLEAIAKALGEVACDEPETDYLRQLKRRVDRVVERYRVNVEDLREAHTWLRRIADCLRYPPSGSAPEPTLTSEQVKREMEELQQSFQPDLKRRPAQAALYGAWHRTWEGYGPDLLHCYDIPGLPPDNLMLESLFGRLRRHQRRVSGRKSTRELRDFGQYQSCFWLRARRSCWNRSARCLSRSIVRTGSDWRRPKPHADCSIACIVIRSVRCAAWSSNTPHVERLSR